MNAKLIFEGNFDDLAAFEAQSRGYLSHVAVELDDGARYPVIFYDPVRLQQDLDERTKHGWPYLADPGMIVVPEVTLEHMKHAIARLEKEGFFSHLRELQEVPAGSNCSVKWPPARKLGVGPACVRVYG